MNRRSTSFIALPLLGAAGLFAAVAFGSDRASADISTPGATGGELIHGVGELRTECYQHGKKIVDVAKLDGLNVGFGFGAHAGRLLKVAFRFPIAAEGGGSRPLD